MRHCADVFGRRFDLVGRPGDDPIPRQYRHPDIRAHKLRQQPSAAPNIRASGFFFVTVNTLFYSCPRLCRVVLRRSHCWDLRAAIHERLEQARRDGLTSCGGGK
jgi:hypothetical protein